MARFISRVELHHAAYDDYEKLHTEMAKQGFLRVIQGSDGKTYQLPTGDYYGQGSVTLEVAYKAVCDAVDRTGKAYEVIISETSASRWIGLKQVS